MARPKPELTLSDDERRKLTTGTGRQGEDFVRCPRQTWNYHMLLYLEQANLQQLVVLTPDPGQILGETRANTETPTSPMSIVLPVFL